MNTFKDRVRNRRKELGLSQDALAKKAGLSQTTISDIERGRNDGSREILPLAKALQCSQEHLLEGKPMADEPSISTGLTLYPDKRGIPIISWVQAGTWREIVDSFPRGGADEYILAHNSHGPHTFAVRIIGNSMEPEFREHDIVVIDPDVRPSPGDYVVARNHSEEATFKKYRPRGIVDGQEIFELVPLNEDYAVMRSNEQPIQIVGTMVEHTRFRRS